MKADEFPMIHEWGARAGEPIAANSYLFQEVFIRSQRCFCRSRFKLGQKARQRRAGEWRVTCPGCGRQRSFFFSGVSPDTSAAASDRFERLWHFLGLGLEAAKSKDLYGAEAFLIEVVELEPWWGFAHLQLGAVRMAIGAMDEAKGSLERAVSILPLDAEVHEALAHCLSELGEAERSQRHAWLALQLEESGLDELSLQR